MDLSIFTTPEAWISLVTLIFLEIVLGIDNLVFISITTNRLPEEKQHIGRKLGLAGALIMRVIFLCFASYLVHMTNPIFTLDLGSYNHGFSVRDIVLLLGGAYLIYKGITEVIDMLRLTEVKAAHSEEHRAIHTLTLPKAVATIMVMDIVFSIDSVITAVGMADHLIIMIIAVMIAVFMMMIFIDPISNFINGHPEMKLLALTFIVAIGCLLVMDSLGFHTGIELIHMPLEKLIVYFAMVFCIVLELIQMRYNKSLKQYHKEHWQAETAQQIDALKAEMLERLEEEKAKRAERKDENPAGADNTATSPTPIFIGGNVYIMAPIVGQDAATFRRMIEASDELDAALNEPIEIETEAVEVLDDEQSNANK
ncbi:TerC family protein [uncultured Slackia sp.]|uniref:TerC family protein n=1 Tax=uncultured Slackia sp. TaxID=665903 RepID=UPI0025F50F8D|nr:TerC family protein [uncultured Slackia sp.]